MEESDQVYRDAEQALGDERPGSPAQWWQEWVHVRLDRLWLLYWVADWRGKAALVLGHGGYDE